MSMIYKITSEGSNKVYVGSCSNRYLSQRLAEHRYSHKVGRKCESSEVLKLPGRIRIHQLELVKCESKDSYAIRCREQYYIDYYGDDCVNKQRAITKKMPKSQKLQLGSPICDIKYLFD